MTKFKVCAKIHLFIIISAIIIAVGMAVGTVCHFCANGFFNYGGEFASYKCVTVTYVNSENKDEESIKPLCEQALGEFKAYEVSYAETSNGGEITYKFANRTDSAKLQAAVDELYSKLDETGSHLNDASLREVKVSEGGAKAITFASIALASAAAFQFIYFIFRYKLRAAFSALLASVHNLGVFVALAAITRIPVGAEMIAIGAAVVVLTMILTCVLFDRTRKNFKNDKYEKTERLEVVDISAQESRKVTFAAVGALACAAVVFGAFATIAAMYIGAFAPYILAVLGLVACLYGAVFFTPAVHGAIDTTCEKVKSSIAPSQKTKKTAKTQEVEKA